MPFFILSLTADVRDKAINNTANARKTSLWLLIQLPIATLPSPKLTRISEACQQKAKIKADIIEPVLLNILITCCSRLNPCLVADNLRSLGQRTQTLHYLILLILG